MGHLCIWGVSKNRGTPKWMVYSGKPYQNRWFGGTIIFGNTPYIDLCPEYPCFFFRLAVSFYVGKFFKSFLSIRLEELEAFAQVLDAPVRPVCAILGGAKVGIWGWLVNGGDKGEKWGGRIGSNDFFCWGGWDWWDDLINLRIFCCWWKLISGEWQDPVDQEHAGQGSQDCVVISLT